MIHLKSEKNVPRRLSYIVVCCLFWSLRTCCPITSNTFWDIWGLFSHVLRNCLEKHIWFFLTCYRTCVLTYCLTCSKMLGGVGSDNLKCLLTTCLRNWCDTFSAFDGHVEMISLSPKELAWCSGSWPREVRGEVAGRCANMKKWIKDCVKTSCSQCGQWMTMTWLTSKRWTRCKRQKVHVKKSIPPHQQSLAVWAPSNSIKKVHLFWVKLDSMSICFECFFEEQISRWRKTKEKNGVFLLAQRLESSKFSPCFNFGFDVSPRAPIDM